MSGPFPKEILPKHTAIFGMTGSGKSTTARDLVEQVVAEGSRVCILDTVKSDWWGITSSADGKKPGLPFTIMGGPHQHLPLTRTMGKALGEIIATGALPLSIIDMVDFGMGDLAHFFVDFAPVLMKKMRGVLYLVIEEAHELAPKERAGFDKENLGVYWAKKLATAGRTRGLRMVVLSQRVQSLHNAVIGSCETVVVHRMTAPADQKPVVDWLKGNVKDIALRKAIEEAMSSLADGQGYLCSGAAKLFELIQFPRAKTFDNTAAPTDDSALQDVKTAKVNTEELRTILAGAVKEAEANDPALLKKRIAELERQIRVAPREILAANVLNAAFTPCPADHAALENHGYERGHQEGWAACAAATKKSNEELFASVVQSIEGGFAAEVESIQHHLDQKLNVPLYYPKPVIPPPDGVALTSAPHPKGPGVGRGNGRIHKAALETVQIDVPVTGVQQRILDALAELNQMGANNPTPELLAIMAGYTNLRSKGYRNALSSLRTGGMLEGLTLTPAGRAAARPPPAPRDVQEMQATLISRLGGVAGRILTPLIEVYPGEMDRDTLGRTAGYENLRSKGFRNALSQLRTLGFVEYAASGGVMATAALFP